MELDQIDRKILRHLQENARITNADLAEKVGLSPTPCLRRLRRLEADGVIKGYRTEINKEAIGISVTVLLYVKLEKEDDTSLRAFEQKMKEEPAVMQCVLVTGKFDYFLCVVVPTLTSYESFLSETLLKVANVATVESSFILREVSNKKVLPMT